jgi:ribonuclease VapC
VMIDSSAVLAVVFQEPEAHRMATAIASATVRRMSAVNWLEVLMVVEGRYGAESADEALLILQDLEVDPVPFDANRCWKLERLGGALERDGIRPR